MKHFVKRFSEVILAIVVVLLSAGCKDDDSKSGVDDSNFTSLLQEAAYLVEADHVQPVWLQALISESPYLDVFHSDARGGRYLVVFPQRGFSGTLYNNDGKPLSESADEEWAEMVSGGAPWTCTHIYTPALKPGDAEWDFQRYTVQEIKQKLLLPEALLKTMTTSDLLEVCLDYQYSSDFLFYDEQQQGIEFLRKEFNGYDELLQRKDLVETMLMKYRVKLRSVDIIARQEQLVMGAFSIHFMLFKMLAAQDEVLESLNREQLRQLITLSIEAWNMVAERPEVFGSINYSPILFLFTRIIVREGKFQFASDDERQKVEYYAETCTANPMVLAVFTEEFQQRMFAYLGKL